MDTPSTRPLRDRYQELVPDREPFLRRARACAALTVPAVAPPEGHSHAVALPSGYSSFGGRGSINLASKLTLSFLPPGASSFALTVPVKTLMEEGVLSPPPEIVKGLAQVEKLVNAKIEALKWRRPTFVTVLHLIVAGNIVEYLMPDGRIKQFRLDQYVAVRDFGGTTIEIVTCEPMRVRALPVELRSSTQKKEDETAYLYTRFVRLDDKRYSVRQDLDDVTVQPEKVYNGLMPANALAWDLVPGESYGRSHVETNYADLVSLDGLSQSIREISALASKHYTFVRPNAAGGNLRKRIAEARNGAVLSGNIEDVNAYQFQVGNALVELRAEKESLKRDLAQAFLLTGDLRRDAERVTAYELRMIVQEIESALGGTYSLLSSELQGWRLHKLIAQMRSRQEIPQIGEGDVEIVVTTGLEALGNDEKLNRVRAFLGLMAEAQPFQQELPLYVNLSEVLVPAAVALGFPSAIRTEEEAQHLRDQQLEKEAMVQAMTAAAGPLATAAVSQPPAQ